MKVELLYLDTISCGLVPIKNLHSYEIRIDKYEDYYSFNILGLKRLYQNNFLFSIYKKFYTKELSTEKWVDQDIVYMFENKERACQVDYCFLDNLWKEAEDIDNLKLEIKENNKDNYYLIVKGDDFYTKLTKQAKQVFDLTVVRRDVNKMIYDCRSLNSNYILPDSIKKILKED